jgi:UDP-N-acetylmuramate: L-alanyl-gamma-D-glutamyl-meso-diaminopimelate ligase
LHIHILGICGTFMGGLAVLAKQAGHTVTGSDANVYPPMSTQLEAQGIELTQGYAADQLHDGIDQVIVGNAMSRGCEVVEAMLNKGMAYNSGPQWLVENVLQDKWVLAVAGTHGKTTTSSLLAWILEFSGLKPGFLIGGVAGNFAVSARLGESPFFVLEADEYDTAFFDKRSKFVHYRPRTVILNNLEFDHADIFADLEAIKKQFHHLLRTIPGEGLIIRNARVENLQQVMDMGCWSKQETFADEGEADWLIDSVSADGRGFDIQLKGKAMGVVNAQLLGRHNRMNALAAIVAARHVGVPVNQSIEALLQFKGVKRRMEVRGEINGITVYDDFAHHPTAIIETIEGLRRAVGNAKIWAVLEPRSNTMRMGVYKEQLIYSLTAADRVLVYQPEDVDWNMHSIVDALGSMAQLHTSISRVVDALKQKARSGDHILVMSNGAFGGVHQKILDALAGA